MRTRQGLYRCATNAQQSQHSAHYFSLIQLRSFSHLFLLQSYIILFSYSLYSLPKKKASDDTQVEVFL